ncbi:TPA: hypothetical protein ACSPZU_004090, partial [Aeromonas veronii]
MQHLKWNQTSDQEQASVMASNWLLNCNILDTETTGLDDQAEIVEISIIDQLGKVVFDSLVKPQKPIPAE